MIKERILELLKNQNINKEVFFSKIGMTSANFRGSAKERPINSNAIENIFSEIPNLNLEWLLTGKGEMLIEEKATIVEEEEIQYRLGKPLHLPIGKTELIPFYEVDFVAGGLETFDTETITPEYYMDIPQFSGCKAFRAYSDSMENLIKSGATLFGKKIDNWQEHLEYGQIYGIITTDGRRYLKYIRRAQNSNEYFLLRSENQNYDDFDMPKKSIRSIWLIDGWINRRT